VTRLLATAGLAAAIALTLVAGAKAQEVESRMQVLDRLKDETTVLKYLADVAKEETRICDEWANAQKVEEPVAAFGKCKASLPPMTSSYCDAFTTKGQHDFCASYIVALRKKAENE
jgi:hypothetical protein